MPRQDSPSGQSFGRWGSGAEGRAHERGGGFLARESAGEEKDNTHTARLGLLGEGRVGERVDHSGPGTWLVVHRTGCSIPLHTGYFLSRQVVFKSGLYVLSLLHSLLCILGFPPLLSVSVSPSE